MVSIYQNSQYHLLADKFVTNETTIPIPQNSRYHNYPIALYFAGGEGNLYQLKQWITPLILLNQQFPLVIIVRSQFVYEWLQKNTEFQIAFCGHMDDLLHLYEHNDFKVVLYVNNASSNFQSLMNNRSFHIHINHGESEKSSTFSNRAKAYDAVFIVSDAGYEKYKENLINITMERFIKIGRPQLDYIAPVQKPKTDRKIILYGPTWEGAHLSMNYSSLVDFGATIVETILSSDEYFLIYRPHPNTGSRDNATKIADTNIRNIIQSSPNATIMTDCDINALYKFVDLAILDNSAIAIDFLYYNRPILMTNYFHRIQGRYNQPRILEAVTLLENSNIYELPNLINNELLYDKKRAQRETIKRYFLGDFKEGESTKCFIEEIAKLMDKRDQFIQERIS